jgi:hypothetical protein
MAIEQRRGCGYRKAGGLYLVGALNNMVPVDYLPTCIDYAQTRGATWAEPKRLLLGVPPGEAAAYRAREKALLMWVGAEHYATTADFLAEARSIGVSKRIQSIPDDAKIGDAVALAHPKALTVGQMSHEPGCDSNVVTDWRKAGVLEPKECSCSPAHVEHYISTIEHPGCAREITCANVPVAIAVANAMTRIGSESMWKERCERAVKRNLPEPKYQALPKYPTDRLGGVFCLFTLDRLELVLPESVAKDPEIARKCADRGVTIISVPDHDPDHVPAGWKLPLWLVDEPTVTPPSGVLEEGKAGPDSEQTIE